ncbi:MAG TPA: hypothetical protein VNT52_00730, partial [Acidimicrobiales bacterium]|nr:hypothetical protein [Acidimicrobiales bacterium]
MVRPASGEAATGFQVLAGISSTAPSFAGPPLALPPQTIIPRPVDTKAMPVRELRPAEGSGVHAADTVPSPSPPPEGR